MILILQYPIATIQYGGIFSCIPPICIQARSKKRSEPECENHQQSTLSSTWNSYSSDNKAAPSALCRFSSSNILMWSWIRYSFIEIHLHICIFCRLFFLYEPWLAWDRGRAYFWFFAWGGGDHLNLWIWGRMTWWPYLSENYVTRWIRLCHLSTISFHFPEHNSGGLTRIQNKGLLTRWCFLDNWQNISCSKILFFETFLEIANV